MKWQSQHTNKNIKTSTITTLGWGLSWYIAGWIGWMYSKRDFTYTLLGTITYPVTSWYFWVHDFPALPFGGICFLVSKRVKTPPLCPRGFHWLKRFRNNRERCQLPNPWNGNQKEICFNLCLLHQLLQPSVLDLRTSEMTMFKTPGGWVKFFFWYKFSQADFLPSGKIEVSERPFRFSFEKNGFDEWCVVFVGLSLHRWGGQRHWFIWKTHDSSSKRKIPKVPLQKEMEVC